MPLYDWQADKLAVVWGHFLEVLCGQKKIDHFPIDHVRFFTVHRMSGILDNLIRKPILIIEFQHG